MPQSLQAAATQHAPRCLGSDAWQALQNRGRDVTYLCTVLVATCLLAARIIPSYCDSYPSCVGRTWSRRAVCGCLLPSGTGSTGQERSAVSQAVLVINSLVQLVTGPWLIGWLVQCYALPAVALLAASHLLIILAPLPRLEQTRVGAGDGPCPPSAAAASTTRAFVQPPTQQAPAHHWWSLPWRLTWSHPDWYWRLPGARNTAAMLLRLCICSVGSLGIGPLRGVQEMMQYHPLMQWPHMHYLWPCWQACCMLLPLRLQVLTCCYEWAMAYYTVCRLKGWSLSQQSMWTLGSHLVLGGGLVVVVPVAAAWLAQRSYDSRYDLYRRQADRAPSAAGPAGGAGTKKGDPGWEDEWESASWPAEGAASSTSCSARPHDSSTRVVMPAGPAASSRSHLTARRLADDGLPATYHDTPSPLPIRDAGGVISAASPPELQARWQQVHDQLASLFGTQWARDTPQAAQAAVSPRSLDYTAASGMTPVGIKVHTRHSQVGRLGPVLRRCAEASLVQELAASATQAGASAAAAGVAAHAAPAAPLGLLQAACFAGCVQLLGALYSMGADRADASKLRMLRMLSELLVREGVAGSTAAAGGASNAAAVATGLATGRHAQVVALQQRLEGLTDDWEEEEEEGAATVDILVGDLVATLAGAGGVGFPADGLLAYALAAGLQLLYMEPPAITAAGGDGGEGNSPTTTTIAAEAVTAAHGVGQPAQELVVYLDWPEEEQQEHGEPPCTGGHSSNHSSHGGSPPVHLVAGQSIADAAAHRPAGGLLAGISAARPGLTMNDSGDGTPVAHSEGREVPAVGPDPPKPLGRLLMFKEQEVVVDQVVVLQQQIRVLLPPLQQGAYYVALLPYEASSPSSNMQDGAEGEQLMAGAVPLSASGHMGASATTTNNSSSSSGGAMCSAPLVMSPLVVLPAAAAQELQQLWEVGCAAMQERGAAGASPPAPGLPQEWPADKQAAWASHRAKVMMWDACMEDLIQDISAVLAWSSNPASFTAAAAAAAAAGGRSSPPASTSTNTLEDPHPYSSSTAGVGSPGVPSDWCSNRAAAGGVPQAGDHQQVLAGEQMLGVPMPLAAPLLELQEVTARLMSYCWRCDMLATANLLVSSLATLATTAAPDSPAAAAANATLAPGTAAAESTAAPPAAPVAGSSNGCSTSGDSVLEGQHKGLLGPGVIRGTHVTPLGDAQQSSQCAVPARPSVQQQAAACAASSSSSSSSRCETAAKPGSYKKDSWPPGVEAAAAGPQLAAAAQRELAGPILMNCIWAVLWGFQAPGLEAAYVAHISRLPMWGDVASLCIPLLPLVLGESWGVVLELRHLKSAQHLLGCLGGLLGLVALGMAPSLGRVLVGPWRSTGLWREWAHLAVEAALATGVLANLLGWPCLVSGRFQASSAWGSWHLLVALVLRAVLRKVRLRLQLPWLALEQATMASMAFKCAAASPGLLLLHHACCLVVCVVCVGALEVWCRHGFLKAHLQHKATAAC